MYRYSAKLAEYRFLYLYLNIFATIEAGKILSVIDIAELVANNASIADGCIYVGVRVAKYPRIDTTGCDKANSKSGNLQFLRFAASRKSLSFNYSSCIFMLNG